MSLDLFHHLVVQTKAAVKHREENPSMFRSGFRRFCTSLMVLSSFAESFEGKNSGCTGMMTESAAVSAFTVIRPSEGAQSRIIYS